MSIKFPWQSHVHISGVILIGREIVLPFSPEPHRQVVSAAYMMREAANDLHVALMLFVHVHVHMLCIAAVCCF